MNSNIVFLCVGCIIGWGAFIMPQEVFLSQAGLLNSIIGLFIGAIFISLIAYNHIFLLARFPKVGGEFLFTLKILGKFHGFVCGWFLSFAYLCIIPLNASALNAFIELVFGKNLYLGSLAILIIAYINLYGINTALILQKILTMLLCGSVLIFFILMALQDSSWNNLSFYITSFDIKKVIAIIALAPWLYLGFDCAVQIIDEVKCKINLLFRIILFSIFVGFGLYCLLIFITGFSSPTMIGEKWILNNGIKEHFGVIGSVMLWIGVFGAILSGINGFFISTTKLLSAMSLYYDINVINNKFDISYKIIFFITLIAFTMSLFGRKSLLYIIDMSCIGIIIGFLYVGIVSFIYKYHKLQNISFGSILCIILSLIFLSLFFIPTSPSALKMPSIIALLIWSILGFCIYRICK